MGVAGIGGEFVTDAVYQAASADGLALDTAASLHFDQQPWRPGVWKHA